LCAQVTKTDSYASISLQYGITVRQPDPLALGRRAVLLVVILVLNERD